MSGVTTAAAPTPIAPIGVAIWRFSCRMRAITGKAVTASAAPRTRPWVPSEMPAGLYSVPEKSALNTKPSATGTTTTESATTPICSPLPFRKRCCTSSPTRNMKKTSVSVPMKFRKANDWSGKTSLTRPWPTIASLLSVVWVTSPRATWPPSTVGPIRMPATISPTTRGCLIRTNSAPTSRAAIRMIARSIRM